MWQATALCKFCCSTLHRILKKYFVRENGTLKTRRKVKFNLSRSSNKYSLHHWHSTPYPPALLSKYVSSSDDLSPSGSYQTVSRYPLDRGFIHHYIWPANPVPSTSTIIPKQEQIATIQAKRSMPKVTMDWINYQGGAGSRFNPIIVEDDWFGGINSLVRGIVMIVFTILLLLFSLTHCLLQHARTIIECFLLMTHCLNAALYHSSFVSYLHTLPQRSLVSFFFCFIFTHTASTRPHFDSQWPRLIHTATLYLVYKPLVFVVAQ